MAGPSACPRCKTTLEPGSRFCSRCGAAIAGATDPTMADMAMTPLPSTDPMIGRQIIGQYVIRRKLGEGGMGAVYVADQPSVGRTAVIKVLHPQFSRDRNMAARFEIEAKAAARLTNPHIVAIYNYGDIGDGTLFLAMEHLEGRSLDEAITGSGRMAPARAVRIAAQVCDALAEAHRAGIVHRDLKPSNIMLVRRGRETDFAKVLDFGIAKLEGVRMTATGAVFGTPQYMSPEQLRGETIDGRSDIYSLAVIVFEMLSGQLPFRSSTPAGFMHKHISEPPPRFRTLDPQLEVPPALEAAVQRALAKDPGARPQTAEAFAEEMEAAVGRALAVASPDGIAPIPTVSPVGPATQRGRVVKMRVAWALGGVLAAGGVGAAVLLHRSPPQQPPAVVQTSRPDAAAAVKAAPPDAAATVAEAPRTTPPPPQAPPQPKTKKIARAPKLPAGPLAGPPPGGGGSPTGLANLPPGSEELIAKPIPELESELRRVVAKSRLPPSSIKQVFESYALQSRLAAPEQREQYQRSFLVNLIVAYRKPELHLQAGEDRPVAELKKIFLTTPFKNKDMKDETRQTILDNLLKAYDGDSFKPEDRDFYRRMALANAIKSYAEDPSVLDKR